MRNVSIKNPESYERFAPFYDAVMGDRKEATRRLLGFVQTYNPKAKKILELGCGTGSVLQHFGKGCDLYGLDLSSKMLAVAKKKVPRASLSRQNMESFRLPERFDIILCVFDTINHVLSFSGWQKVFANAHGHLAEGGVFIFDINTRKKLSLHAAERPWFHAFGSNFLVMTVSIDRKGVSNWNIKVFEHTRRNQYVLHEENIKEVSFPKDQITRALKSHFSTVKVIDPERTGERLYFICKK
jgi:SAM-dependent methyltransferase